MADDNTWKNLVLAVSLKLYLNFGDVISVASLFL